MTDSLGRRVYKKNELEGLRISPLNADFAKGYPVGAALYYHCLDCDEFVPSLPSEPLGCQCRNVFIETDAGRLSIGNDQHVRLVELRNQQHITP